MNISKEISTGNNVRKLVSSRRSLSDTNSDQPLLVALRARRLEKTIVGEPIKATTSTLPLQKKVKVEIIIHGQADSKSKAVVQESSKGKVKKNMQPFAMSPMKKKAPLNEDVGAFLNRKKRKVPIQKPCKGSMKVKKKKLNSKEESKPTLKKGLKKTTILDSNDTGYDTEDDTEDNMEDDSDNEDFERRAKGESSGAEVKGDVDWCP